MDFFLNVQVWWRASPVGFCLFSSWSKDLELTKWATHLHQLFLCGFCLSDSLVFTTFSSMIHLFSKLSTRLIVSHSLWGTRGRDGFRWEALYFASLVKFTVDPSYKYLLLRELWFFNKEHKGGTIKSTRIQRKLHCDLHLWTTQLTNAHQSHFQP